MDFGFTSEQEELRAEMRAFLNGPTVQGILAGLRALPPRAAQHSETRASRRAMLPAQR